MLLLDIEFIYGNSVNNASSLSFHMFIPSKKALYCTFEAGDEHTFTSSFKKVIENAKKQGYTLISNPFGRLLMRTQNENHMKRYFELWLPIE